MPVDYNLPQKWSRLHFAIFERGIIFPRMSPETTNMSATKVCPTCGTRLAENAVRCLVCGTEFSATMEMKKPRDVQASRMPEITLGLPAALGLLALFLIVGAALVFFVLRLTGGTTPGAGKGPVATASITTTITPTATDAPTETPVPTSTTQPPHDYTVRSGDTCSSIAVSFSISVQSLIILDNLSASCILSVGQVIKVPYPTATPAPEATSTLDAVQAEIAACDKVAYTVQANDTLSSIAANYRVSGDAIKSFNGLASDTVFLGMNIWIPLCKRAPTPGPTPTATTPPPYPAPNLLLPADGASFTLTNDSLTLQWASVGTLRDNESYIVTIEDVTDGQGRRLVDYVSDTKYIIPPSFRPKDNLPHIFRWWIGTARQTGSDDQGQPIWTSAGALSLQRVFSWQGVALEPTPTP
jgi:LysM repeat protein